ncbi:recombinase family protein [Methylobacterium aquaticum]|uniref:recombinase family protein n=1 Tax=Methylobacterium aquaticum TaxID=270351 RepID=UPI003D7C17AE
MRRRSRREGHRSRSHWQRRAGHVLDLNGKGDAPGVTYIDRLSRSRRNLQDIVSYLKAIGASLVIIVQPIDIGTESGHAASPPRIWSG